MTNPYQPPQSPFDDVVVNDHGKKELPRSYRDAIKFALAYEIPITIIGILLLDTGRVSSVILRASSGHWLLMLFFYCWRPTTPRETDVALIRYGFFLFLFLIVVFKAAVG